MAFNSWNLWKLIKTQYVNACIYPTASLFIINHISVTRCPLKPKNLTNWFGFCFYYVLGRHFVTFTSFVRNASKTVCWKAVIFFPWQIQKAFRHDTKLHLEKFPLKGFKERTCHSTFVRPRLYVRSCSCHSSWEHLVYIYASNKKFKFRRYKLELKCFSLSSYKRLNRIEPTWPETNRISLNKGIFKQERLDCFQQAYLTLLRFLDWLNISIWRL